MRHRKKKVSKLGRPKDHRKALIKNLATAIIIYEKIQTTEAKAKIVAPLIDKLIKISKEKEKMNAIREIHRHIQHENCSRKLLEDLAARYKDRTSGFTRTIAVKLRKGDNAPIVQIELV
jgi:large subunit ribosomal protein L17